MSILITLYTMSRNNPTKVYCTDADDLDTYKQHSRRQQHDSAGVTGRMPQPYEITRCQV